MPPPQLQPETQYVPTGMYDITQFPANSFVVKYIDPVSGNVGKAAVMSTVSGGSTTYSILIGSTQYQLVGYQTHYADVYSNAWITADICDPADANAQPIDFVASPKYQWHDSFGNPHTGPIKSRDVYINLGMSNLFYLNMQQAINTLPSSSSYPQYIPPADQFSGNLPFLEFYYNGQTGSNVSTGVTTYGGWSAVIYNGITYPMFGFMVTTTPNITFPWKSTLPISNGAFGPYSTYGQYITENKNNEVNSKPGIRYSPNGTITLNKIRPGYIWSGDGVDMYASDPFQIWRWATQVGSATSNTTTTDLQASLRNFCNLLLPGETFQITGPYGGWSGNTVMAGSASNTGLPTTNFASEIISVSIGGQSIKFCFRSLAIVPYNQTDAPTKGFISKLSFQPSLVLDINTNVIQGQALVNSIPALSSTKWFTTLPNPSAVVLSPYTGQFSIPGAVDSLGRPVRVELIIDAIQPGKTVPGIYTDPNINNTAYSSGNLCVPYQMSQFTAADLAFLQNNLGLVPIIPPDAPALVTDANSTTKTIDTFLSQSATNIDTVQNSCTQVTNSMNAVQYIANYVQGFSDQFTVRQIQQTLNNLNIANTAINNNSKQFMSLNTTIKNNYTTAQSLSNTQQKSVYSDIVNLQIPKANLLLAQIMDISSSSPSQVNLANQQLASIKMNLMDRVIFFLRTLPTTLNNLWQSFLNLLVQINDSITQLWGMFLNTVSMCIQAPGQILGLIGSQVSSSSINYIWYGLIGLIIIILFVVAFLPVITSIINDLTTRPVVVL